MSETTRGESGVSEVDWFSDGRRDNDGVGVGAASGSAAVSGFKSFGARGKGLARELAMNRPTPPRHLTYQAENLPWWTKLSHRRYQVVLSVYPFLSHLPR